MEIATPERVSFFSGGVRIAAHWYSADVPTTAPCVVLCAGFCQTKEMLMPEVATALSRAGYHALAFDYRFIGESDGEPKTRLVPEAQVYDIRSALTWVEGQPRVDNSRLALWGCSFGGATAIAAAARDARVRCVVSNVGVMSGRRWLRSIHTPETWNLLLDRVEADRHEFVRTGTSDRVRPNEVLRGDSQTASFIKETWGHLPNLVEWLTLESVDAILEFDPEVEIARISPRPLLVIAAERDQIVPNEETYAGFDAAGEPKKLVWLPRRFGHWGAETGEGLDLVLEATIDWFDRWLPPS